MKIKIEINELSALRKVAAAARELLDAGWMAPQVAKLHEMLDNLSVIEGKKLAKIRRTTILTVNKK